MKRRKAAVRARHDARTVYIVYVLWMIGHPLSAIARVTGLRTRQVGGIVGNSEFRNRAAMSQAEIRQKLAELQAIRYDAGEPVDGGSLDRIKFEPLPLSARQRGGPLKRKKVHDRLGHQTPSALPPRRAGTRGPEEDSR